MSMMIFSGVEETFINEKEENELTEILSLLDKQDLEILIDTYKTTLQSIGMFNENVMTNEQRLKTSEYYSEIARKVSHFENLLKSLIKD